MKEMTDEQLSLLKQFVLMCKANPGLLHQPQYAFYREYLERQTDETFEENQEEEKESDLPLPELDNSGVIEDKTCGEEYAMGDPEKEVSDEDMEKAQEHRQAAQMAFADGDYEKSVEEYTKAIEFNPGLAILHAKRASLLGNWAEAHLDLALSCKLDYDDQANEWLKEVEPNAKKLHDYQRAKERLADEKETRARQERVRRAQEENKRAAEENKQKYGEDSDDFDGDVPPGLFESFKNNPELAKIMEELKKDPSKIGQYLNDPNVLNLIGMMGGKGGGGFNPNAFNMPTGDTDDSTPFKQEPPKKAPEPDLD
uniref:STI1 domain-containing protein n=1 Tax=Meloidogyne javanica TaxID=6303 RepID=A0A915MNP9_MELJA